jgi:outer membrane receptor protein involved in Fe transport
MATRLRNTSVTASADWQHFFSADRRHYFIFSYLMSYSPQKQTTEQLYDDYQSYDFFSENKPKSLEQTLQVDYTRPLSDSHTLSLGGKYIMRDNRSWAEDRFVQHADQQSQSSFVEYQHDNDIAAAYAEYEARMGIVGAKAGLRYEHTFQKVRYLQGAGSDFSNDYGNLVPSLSLSLSPKPTQNIGLTYNMRLSRPGITYLNPYVDRTLPSIISYGNSHLDVEKTHNIGASYSSFSQKFMLNIALHQIFSNNQISQYSFFADDVLQQTYGNVVKMRNTSLTAFANWLVAKNTRLMLNGGINYIDLRSKEVDARNHGWQGNFLAGLQQTLPWDLQLSANVIASMKTYTLQGWSTGFQGLVGSLSKSLLNDRLNISLSAITGLEKGGDIHIDSYSAGRDFVHRQNISVPISQVQLVVSYTFGNTGIKAKEHKTRIENDFLEKKSEQEQISNTSSSM